jgi:hypothetical protein
VSALDGLLNMVKASVLKHSADQGHTGFDPSNLLGHIEEIFGQHAARSGGQNQVRPASEDPYGDPADEARGSSARSTPRPASEDPYGDPADERKR